MSGARSIPWIDAGIVLLCGWRAAPSLAGAWQHAPFDRWGWLAFLVWLLPLVLHLTRYPRDAGNGPAVLPWAALGLALLGRISDINALNYAALAAALGRFLPARPLTWAWLALALCWMPALGWLGTATGPTALNTLRLLLAAAAATLGLRAARLPSGTFPAGPPP